MQDKPTSEPSIQSALIGLVEQIKEQNELLGLMTSQTATLIDLLMEEPPEDEHSFQHMGQRQ